MTAINFRWILVSLVGPAIKKKNTNLFRSTAFHKLLEDCSLNLLQNYVLPGRQKVIPHHVFAADDAFPLPLYIMQPHGGRQEKGLKNRVFNYCLCRARRVVESVIGTLSSVFRVFRKPMLLQPQITLAMRVPP
jgi:hypothetical protein